MRARSNLLPTVQKWLISFAFFHQFFNLSMLVSIVLFLLFFQLFHPLLLLRFFFSFLVTITKAHWHIHSCAVDLWSWQDETERTNKHIKMHLKPSPAFFIYGLHKSLEAFWSFGTPFSSLADNRIDSTAFICIVKLRGSHLRYRAQNSWEHIVRVDISSEIKRKKKLKRRNALRPCDNE